MRDIALLQSLRAAEPIVIDLDQFHVARPIVILAEVTSDPLDAFIAILCEAELAWEDSRLLALEELSTVIEDQALSLGLTTVARVARQTSDLAQGGDAVALAANLARLVRVGEASLTAMLGLQDDLL